MIWAHSIKDSPPDQWQPLDQHLHNVSERAAKFAAPFLSADWAALAGLLHDIGKASDALQAECFLYLWKICIEHCKRALLASPIRQWVRLNACGLKVILVDMCDCRALETRRVFVIIL